MANRSGLNETGLRGRGSEIRQVPARKRGEILRSFCFALFDLSDKR